MNILIFDVETTGLPKKYNAPSSEVDNWPHIVELGVCLLVGDAQRWKIAFNDSWIIEPDGYTIPSEASDVHGIPHEQAVKEGIPLETALSIFKGFEENADYLMAHNLSFDSKVVRAAGHRVGKGYSELTKMPSICTMKAATEWCDLPNKNGRAGKKWPKLEEWYEKLFGDIFLGAHCAKDDCKATAQAFAEMWKRELFGIELFEKANADKARIDAAVKAKAEREAATA